MKGNKAKKLRRLAAKIAWATPAMEGGPGLRTSVPRRWSNGTFRRFLKTLKRSYNRTSFDFRRTA